MRGGCEVADKEKKSAPKGERTSAKDIRQAFSTSITGDVATVSDRRTKKVYIQTRIVKQCDPTITNEFIVDISRMMLKYMKAAKKDIEETSQK